MSAVYRVASYNGERTGRAPYYAANLNLSAAELAVISIFQHLVTPRELERLSSALAFPIGTATVNCRHIRAAPDKRIWEYLGSIIFLECGDKKLAGSIATKAIQAIAARPLIEELTKRLAVGVSGALAFLDEQIASIDRQIARIRGRLSRAYRIEWDCVIKDAVIATDAVNAEIGALDCEIDLLRKTPTDEIERENHFWRVRRLVRRRETLNREMQRRLRIEARPPEAGLSQKQRHTIAKATARNRGKTPGTQLQHDASFPPAPAEMLGFWGPIACQKHNFP